MLASDTPVEYSASPDGSAVQHLGSAHRHRRRADSEVDYAQLRDANVGRRDHALPRKIGEIPCHLVSALIEHGVCMVAVDKEVEIGAVSVVPTGFEGDAAA